MLDACLCLCMSVIIRITSVHEERLDEKHDHFKFKSVYFLQF